MIDVDFIFIANHSVTEIHSFSLIQVSRKQTYYSIWRVWSQNAINAKVNKLSYPREKIDDRQTTTIQLPFLCKMRYMQRVHRILQTNGSGIVFDFANKWKRDCICLSIVDLFAGVTQFFHFGLYRVLWSNSSCILTRILPSMLRALEKMRPPSE